MHNWKYGYYFIEVQLVQAVSINCLVIIALGTPDGEKAMIRLRITINVKKIPLKAVNNRSVFIIVRKI